MNTFAMTSPNLTVDKFQEFSDIIWMIKPYLLEDSMEVKPFCNPMQRRMLE